MIITYNAKLAMLCYVIILSSSSSSSSSSSFKVHFSHSVGWTVHFLDGCSLCCPVSWVNVGDIRRSSVFCNCFLPCFAGSPMWFPPSNWKINILWSQWVSSLLATCSYHLSLLFLITCPILIPGPLTGGGLHVSFFYIVMPCTSIWPSSSHNINFVLQCIV